MPRKPSIKEGDVFTTKEGYEIEVLHYGGCDAVTIQFRNGVKRKISASHIRTGMIKNPYHKSVYGVGYLGEGIHKVKDKGVHTKAYNVWLSMLMRCYSSKYQEGNPTYKECFVTA